jgi:cell division protein FtsI/penicillin-binding protein 2
MIPPTKTNTNRPLLPSLLGAGLFLSILFILIITVRLFSLHADFSTQQRHDNKQTQQQKPKTETQLLFEALMKNKQLITIKPDGRIKLPAKDYILARKVSGQAISDEEESLLGRLYYSIAGKAVLHQIKFWNHSRLFAAIRDNLPAVGNKKSESRWRVRNQWDENPTSSDWVPLSYGYVNGGRLRTGFNDWLSVADAMPLRYQTTVSGRRTLRIQVIGRPDLRRLRGKKQLYACYPKKSQHKAGCYKVAKANTNASAYVIVLTLGAGVHKLDLSVTPVTNYEKRIDGIPIYLTKNNQYAWEAIREYHRNPVVSDDLKYSFTLMTKDGQSLINNFDLTPSQFTRNNGLVPLVGYEKSDRYALTGILSRTSLPHDKTEVHLTLDSRLQQITQKNLQEEMPRMGSNADYARQRRAAVVLMNPHTGAILAAANYPNPPSGIHRWDRISYSRLYPNRDPFGVNAWQGLDNHNAPGSTFKPVTAMAAMQAVDEKGRDDLKRIIKGLSARQYQQATGLSVANYSYQPDLEITSKVSNAGNAPLSRSMPYRAKNKEGKTISVYPRLRLGGGGDCAKKVVNSKNLGLQEAVRDSLNVWFARLGVMMDGNKLETGGKDTSLAKMARLLGFGTIVSLASDQLPLSRILGGIGRGDVLNGFAGSLALDDRRIIKTELKNLAENRIRRTTALQRLTQNSFGQGVATTPMQMARVAASVATGKIPQPYLIEKWDGEIQKPQQPRILKLSLIDYLRQGMKAVPEVGTAKHAFSRFYSKGRCRSYGKTGTAQLSGRGKNSRASYNSAWFVGWHEDKKGKPDVSYACMVTHAYAKGKRSGGSVCAPIVARILRDMEKQPAK